MGGPNKTGETQTEQSNPFLGQLPGTEVDGGGLFGKNIGLLVGIKGGLVLGDIGGMEGGPGDFESVGATLISGQFGVGSVGKGLLWSAALDIGGLVTHQLKTGGVVQRTREFMWQVGLDFSAGYLFNLGSGLGLGAKALLGIKGLWGSGVFDNGPPENDTRDTLLNIPVGAGLVFQITDHLNFNADYQHYFLLNPSGDKSYPAMDVITGGVTYTF